MEPEPETPSDTDDPFRDAIRAELLRLLEDPPAELAAKLADLVGRSIASAADVLLTDTGCDRRHTEG